MDKKSLTAIKLLGGAIGIYYVAKNYILNKNTIEQTTATQTARKNNYYNVQSFSNDTYTQYANLLYDYLKYGPSRKDKVIEILNKMLNNIDVEKLMNAYGERNTFLYGMDLGYKNLLSQLAYSLERDKEQVNLNWSKKFIKYRI